MPTIIDSFFRKTEDKVVFKFFPLLFTLRNLPCTHAGKHNQCTRSLAREVEMVSAADGKGKVIFHIFLCVYNLQSVSSSKNKKTISKRGVELDSYKHT